MNENRPTAGLRVQGARLHNRLRELNHGLLVSAGRGPTRQAFLGAAAGMLLEFSGCDVLELLIEEEGRACRCRAAVSPEGSLDFRCWHPDAAAARSDPGEESGRAVLEQIQDSVLGGRLTAAAPCWTRNGSFWTGDTSRPIVLRDAGGGIAAAGTLLIGGEFPSLALIRFPVTEGGNGVWQLGSRQREFFTEDDISCYEAVGVILGAAIAHQGAQWALRERVKELTCLYGIAEAARRPGVDLREILRESVEIIPRALLYPEAAAARILLDGEEYRTDGFADQGQSLASEIRVHGKSRGVIAAAYSPGMPAADEGPFLREERSLMDEVARQLGLIIERRETEEENVRLQQQLRHADRLATIGQLAAGAAHELNEPLGNILGFAELAKNIPRLPKQARADLEKIFEAALHAREVIRKLMIFARQTPTQMAPVHVNDLIEKGLYFLESRCAQEGIRLVRELAADVPAITADASQLHQVLVNLVVNAIQAMPGGGTLFIRTGNQAENVILSVQDTGTGMTEDVIKQIFIPFFTTKQVGQGTGLGLSVVHGIVTAHGGTIQVESQPGFGTRFDILLPTDPARQAQGKTAEP